MPLPPPRARDSQVPSPRDSGVWSSLHTKILRRTLLASSRKYVPPLPSFSRARFFSNPPRGGKTFFSKELSFLTPGLRASSLPFPPMAPQQRFFNQNVPLRPYRSPSLSNRILSPSFLSPFLGRIFLDSNAGEWTFCPPLFNDHSGNCFPPFSFPPSCNYSDIAPPFLP